MTHWTMTEDKAGKKYARQLRLTFKRYQKSVCIDCGQALDGGSRVRCRKHLSYHSKNARENYAKRKLLNGKEEGK